MSKVMPQVPARPTARAHEQAPATGSTLNMPPVPPRPLHRRIDRSPSRERFAGSPLNETSPFATHHANPSKSSLYSSGSANNSATDLPRRPSSVALPSIGQEGSEYAEAFAVPGELGSSPPQTRNVANDLHLHAPRPSLPISSAKARVSTVTRTDSGQAAAYGIGKATGSDDREPGSRDLKTKASFASQASNSTERRPSSVEGDHGIPEIGQRVPMYPNAGDVQAPSPSPYSQPFAPGIGFHNDGTKPRHHGRRTSARGNNDLPLEAYGKHGHGVLPHDRFEKAYYEKHPELIKKELDQYHERPAWAMSSDDLNKIVRDTASRGSGLGASGAIGTPTEQIGFQAVEEYASRMSSPRPQSGYHVSHSNLSETHVDSPLRKESGAEAAEKHEFERTLSRSLQAPSDVALSESEFEDEDTIHVDARERGINKIYGNLARFESTESLGHDTENDEDYGAPILASDEVAKEPFGWDLQPAVSPMNDRRGSHHDDSGHHLRTGSASSLTGSRPSSRPGSIHGNIPGLRMTESTPLEDLEEYEPLFPEDEKASVVAKKPLTAADRLKRPEYKNRKFPSQDVWEDSPNSLQYTATVSTPQLPEANEDGPKLEETPEQAFARRQEELAEAEFQDSESFLNREKKPWAHKSQLAEETRPNLKQRFPSRDVWEDTPDSLQLHTTVSAPQTADQEILSPPDERPTTGAVAYHQEKAAAGLPLSSEEGRATTGIAATLKPQIPTRPARAKPDSPQQPSLPERPSRLRQVDGTSPTLPMKTKPEIPARPSKSVTDDTSEDVPLSQVTSNSSAKSIASDQGSSTAAVSKSKPPVPSRPVGSKIAALQGGFMSDLNKRLQLGPQAPKKEEPAPEELEPEMEKAPLVDARKGRARGPARRAPAKSPTPAIEEGVHRPSPLSFCMTATHWQIDPEDDVLQVPFGEKDVLAAPATKATESKTPTLATNIDGEQLHDTSEIASSPDKPRSLSLAAEPEPTQHTEEAPPSSAPETLEPSKERVAAPIGPPASLSQVQEDLVGSTGSVTGSHEVVE